VRSKISDEEWDLTLATNLSAMFYITKAAVPNMRPGSAIINTASVNADSSSPQLLAYATTKGAIQNFTGGLAQMLAEKGIRVNAVVPGPVWTPLIPSTMLPAADSRTLRSSRKRRFSDTLTYRYETVTFYRCPA
jgi:NAD(P)-dependent dehydrogenase (short-subunit alcohol dehydrogenase family)